MDNQDEENNKTSPREDNKAIMIGINGKEIVIDQSPPAEGKYNYDLLNEIKFHSN